MYEAIKQYMREYYDDEHLAMLLAHAEDGKLTYHSCCCFIGVSTADHALKESCSVDAPHYYAAKGMKKSLWHKIPALKDPLRYNVAVQAEQEFVYCGIGSDRDAVRRSILIPLIREEMARRACANNSPAPQPAEPEPAEVVIA